MTSSVSAETAWEYLCLAAHVHFLFQDPADYLAGVLHVSLIAYYRLIAYSVYKDWVLSTAAVLIA